jgi:hypothetical protein
MSIFCVLCAISNGAGGIGSRILLAAVAQGASVRQYYWPRGIVSQILLAQGVSGKMILFSGP